jgi:para-aminobenzoate synthetase component I
MRAILEELAVICSPEALFARFAGEPGAVLLRSASFEPPQARYSLVTARPFLQFRCQGTRCVLAMEGRQVIHYGNPWMVLEQLLQRYESLEHDLPFPTGGCFGFWGYDLKQFIEPKVVPRAVRDLPLVDAALFFCGSLVVFDHHLDKILVIATGLAADGSSSEDRARQSVRFWKEQLQACSARQEGDSRLSSAAWGSSENPVWTPERCSTWPREAFLQGIKKAGAFIRAGDIYQVNLSQRFSLAARVDPWTFFQHLTGISPAPHAAYVNAGDLVIASSSPELFLRLSGRHVLTRPIKGTRPRSPDRTRDAQLTYELQTSPKELAELVMITDLLRNDLGRICQFGSVHTPELIRLERYALVQHLVSSIEGLLRPEVTHLQALASCFPGGSITGAPKVRAMEIIEALEPVARGPYTGALGYIGFNQESQLSIIIRSALFQEEAVHFQAGAGIVADSDPEAEYLETVAKASGFFRVLNSQWVGQPAGRARLSRPS